MGFRLAAQKPYNNINIKKEDNNMVIGYYREKEGARIPDGCDRLYKEREGFDYIINAVVISMGKGDELRINSISELGKRDKNVMKMIEYMRMKGSKMVCVSEDGAEEELTSDEWYNERVGIVGVVETPRSREWVSEKIKEGIARAKEEGKQIGGEEKYKVDKDKEDMIMKAYELGMMKWEACAKELGGMSKSNFYLRYDKWKGKITIEENMVNEAHGANEPTDKWKGKGVEETND